MIEKTLAELYKGSIIAAATLILFTQSIVKACAQLKD